jgi:hypothetical protein
VKTTPPPDRTLANATTMRQRALAAAVALALFPHASFALMLGEPEVRSALGRALDVRIPVSGNGADAADEACFALLADPAAVNPLARAQLTVEQQGGRTYLRVRSTEAMVEPATTLRVRAACPPASGVLVREYGILLDPVPASAPSVPLTMPEEPMVAKVEVAKVEVAPVPAAAPVAVASTPVAKPAHPGPAHARATPHVPTHASSAAYTRGAALHGGYLLKLSGPVLDLEPSRHVDAAQRAQLREAQAMMLEDDYTSAMLALRSRIDALQKRLGELQLQAATLDTAPALASTPVATETQAAPAMAPPPAERVLSATRRVADAAWSWALVALLGLLALLWPLSRAVRRRREDNAHAVVPAAPVPVPYTGVETGTFAPPPPEVIAPQAPVSAAPAPATADDTEEAIRDARELYNAGERLQAAGVLRRAIESHPERVAPWLPLFDLLMRERLMTEFGELARGFRTLHGASPAWKTVQRAGQQIDPANPLYHAEKPEEQAAA